MTATPDAFKDIAPLLAPSYSTLPFPLPLFTMLASAGILIQRGRYRRTTSGEELARLYHIAIPKQTDLPIQLQYCAESEGPDHSL